MKKLIFLFMTSILMHATILGQTKEDLNALEYILDQTVENTLTTFCTDMNKQLPAYISDCELLSSVFFISQTKTMVMNYNILDDCHFRSKKQSKEIAKVKDRLIGDMFFSKKEISEDAEILVELMNVFDIKFKMVYRNEKATKIFGSFFVTYNDITNELRRRNPR